MSDEPCEMLPWDTKFFGFPIARVKPARMTEDLARSVNDWCREHRVRCVYYSPPQEDALANDEVTTREGFCLVDVKLTLEHPGGSTAAATSVRTAREDDLPTLERIAAESHRGGRFERDRRFLLDRTTDLYRTWVRTGVAEHHVIVVEHNAKPAGYSVCKQINDAGVIWLLAVDSSARGEGLGTKLVNASLRYFAEQGVAPVRVVTQAWNAPAQRLYQRCGFITSSCAFTYHKWFD